MKTKEERRKEIYQQINYIEDEEKRLKHILKEQGNVVVCESCLMVNPYTHHGDGYTECCNELTYTVENYLRTLIDRKQEWKEDLKEL